jgi:hypothetical protein
LWPGIPVRTRRSIRIQLGKTAAITQDACNYARGPRVTSHIRLLDLGGVFSP